jgi:hypothetical protein
MKVSKVLFWLHSNTCGMPFPLSGLAVLDLISPANNLGTKSRFDFSPSNSKKSRLND